MSAGADLPQGREATGESVLRSLLDARLLGRHQLAAMLATVVDFSLMIALVQLAGLPPPIATVLSAISGGIVNFTVSRQWAYKSRHRGTTPSQALRYGMVSFGGALLNAGLLGVVLASVAVPYLAARAVVAIAVSVLYTYPLHTRLVFRVAGEREGGLEDPA